MSYPPQGGGTGGGGGGGGYTPLNKEGANVETLTADKTLSPTDDVVYQILNPNGTNRSVTLDTTGASPGRYFIIKNSDAYNGAYLNVYQGTTLIDTISPQSTKVFVFDGTNWVSGMPGVLDNNEQNLSLGFNCNAKTGGVALGRAANAFNNGVAIGNQANGSSTGIAIGGYLANGSTQGVAIGYYAEGYTYGVGIGYYTRGSTSGVAIGYFAFGREYGVAIGYNARGHDYGVAIGFRAGQNVNQTLLNTANVLIGAFAGYRLTTGTGNIIIGYQAGYDAVYSPTTGAKNILIGYQAGTPSNGTSNFLNIGNLIFGTGVNTATGAAVSNGKVGIATTTPNSRLHVEGSVAASVTTLTASATLDDTHHTVLVDASAGAVTITLPSAAGIAGRMYRIKKIDSSANAVTVAAQTGETIDGAASYDLTAQYQYIVIQSDGANWYIV